jgi:hypothetical protein
MKGITLIKSTKFQKKSTPSISHIRDLCTKTNPIEAKKVPHTQVIVKFT